MNYTQNSRINQVTNNTLVVGVDIAKHIHYARTFDNRGFEFSTVIKFTADKNGFEYFIKWVKRVADENGKNEIIVGIEPTGHYWFSFCQMARKNDILVVQVNPFHVKRLKELDDNTPGKSDRKDPKTIALLVKDGRYQEPYIPVGVYAELRVAVEIRDEKIAKIIRIKNQIIRWLDIYFPEFTGVFKNITGKGAMITLERFPLPDDILSKEAETIVSIWRTEIKTGIGLQRAKELIKAAQRSVGIKEGLKMAKKSIQLLIQEYKMHKGTTDAIMEEIKELSNKISGIKNILSIKGIGLIGAAGFFAEIGDITRFSNPKQIIKLAGLNVVPNSSGQFKGQTKISKRGRKRLRSIMFRAVLIMVAQNDEFKALHKYNTQQKENPLKKMQSLTALCGKLIKVIYRLVVNDEQYDGKKLMLNIHREVKIEAA